MTKTQIWENAQKLMKESKVKNDSKLYIDLELLLAPKKVGSEFPAKLDEDGNIVEVYCNWFKEYKNVSEFNIKKGKPHYECKLAEKEWTKYQKEIKSKENEIKSLINDILDEKLTPAEAKENKLEIENDIQLLKDNRLKKINYEEQ